MAHGLNDRPQPVRVSEERAVEHPVALLGLGGGTPDVRRPLPHSRKFRVATVSLIGLAIGALAFAIVIGTTSSSGGHGGSTSAWSSWSPPDTGLQGAQEIADYIAPYYRATPASQLAVVTAVNLNNQSSPLQVDLPVSGSSGSLMPLPASSTVLYNLCGVGGSNCSIGVGKPSSDRLLLLRREALELALYTFKYLGGINAVVAILPPGHTLEGCTGICAKPQPKQVVKSLDIALAFDRTELQPWLAQPLRQTLPEQLPPTVAQIAKVPEAELVSIITAHGMFSERSEQAQDGSTVMTLTPLPPQ